VTELLAGMMIGLAGSLHCAGMCGPIAVALPHTAGGKGSYVAGRMLYQFGRITTYSVIGALAGLGAGAVSISGYEGVVSITAGILMIVTAVMQILWHKSLIPSGPMMKLTAPVRVGLHTLLQKHSLVALGGIGLINGLLPCGLVLSAVFGSASTADPASGAMFMAAFGVGTLPVMTTLSLGGGALTQRLSSTTKIAMPILALALGAVFVVRGMHLGIPLLSPKPPASEVTASCCTEE
jgi:sulfite exporter TauE/SafE